jgi:type II secretory pathway component PulK
MQLAHRERDRRGVVLLVVLFFALLLTSSIATFVRRATVDALIARNLDARAEADALVRGGLLVAWALLVEDRLQEIAGAVPAGEGPLDLWSRVGALPLVTPSGTSVRLRIEDTGARLNLNALFEVDAEGQWQALEQTRPFLEQVLAKVIDELPLAPGQRTYDPAELAANLVDFVDGDELTEKGSPEEEAYQRSEPPYGPANRPLLSLEELRLAAGFDYQLVEALRRYLTVYPTVAPDCGEGSTGCGVNLNTAPPHVLALLWFNDGSEERLADVDTVRQILRVRAEGGRFCGGGSGGTGCTPIREIVPNPIFPPPTYATQVFELNVEARVGDVRRTGFVVVDRSVPGTPQLLSWRVR